MGLKRKKAVSESKVELLEVGEYEGRLAYVADLGIQKGGEYKGKPKPDTQKLCLGIEILGKEVEIDGEVKPQVLWSNAFAWYENMKGEGAELPLYAVFEPTAAAKQESDWEAQLGKPCTVVIAHSKDGQYANIKALLAIPKKYQDSVPEMATTDSCVGDSDDEANPAQVNTYGLPRWLIENNQVDESGEGVEYEEPEADDDFKDPLEG